jgi:hypothetical protein
MKPDQNLKEENDKIAAEYAAKIEEHEEAQRAKGKIFDPHKLLERASKIHSVEHPVLGQLHYGELTFKDAFEINKSKTDTEKTETIAWLMMRKAYPDLPKDFLTRMPLIESATLIDFLTKQPGFLSAAKTSKAGSKTTRKHKKSG